MGEGAAVSPVPAATLVTVPEPPPPVPFAAAVIMPSAFTVKFVLVYEPATTPEGFKILASSPWKKKYQYLEVLPPLAFIGTSNLGRAGSCGAFVVATNYPLRTALPL
jgi:hypothetical protein